MLSKIRVHAYFSPKNIDDISHLVFHNSGMLNNIAYKFNHDFKFTIFLHIHLHSYTYAPICIKCSRTR